jgi:quercetin dioxygenase-like cupin family protein
MRAKHVLAFAVSFVMAVALLAQASGEAKAKTGGKKMGGKAAVVMPAADLKWSDLDPKTGPGVKIVDVSGNHATGAFSAFIKFPAGFSAPMHTHTADMKLAVVSGTIIHTPDGKPEVRLGPGSYLGQPGGYKHATACDNASECMFYIQSNGKFDLKPVEAPKAAAAPAKK